MKEKSDPTLFRKIIKWILRSLAFVFAVVVLMLLTMPYWFGGVLRLALPEGTTVGDYTRDGARGFELSDVQSAFGESTLEIDRVGALYPTTWLWRGLVGNSRDAFLNVGVVKVDLKLEETEAAEEPSAPISLPDILQQLESGLTLSDKWFPHAVVERLELSSGEQEVVVDGLTWQGRVLSTRLEALSVKGSLTDIKLDLTESPWLLSLDNGAKKVTVDLKVGGAEASASIDGTIGFVGNALDFESEFGASGIIPSSALWNADSWEIEKGDLEIEKSAYDSVLFTLSGEWNGTVYKNEIKGKAIASELGDEWPAIDFDAKVRGDDEILFLEEMNLLAPGVFVNLNKEASVEFATKRLLGDLYLDLDVDLSQLDVENLSGTLKGEARFVSKNGQDPVGAFTVQGEALKWQEYELEGMDLTGALNWPELFIEKGTVNWSETVFAQLVGNVDLESKQILNSEVSFNLSSEALSAFVPEGISFRSIMGSISVTGDMLEPEYVGDIDFEELSQAPLKPLNGGIDFSGKMTDLESLVLKIESGANSLTMQASGAWDEGTANLGLTEFILNSEGAGVMALNAPMNFSATPENEAITLNLDTLNLSAGDSVFAVSASGIFPNALTASLQSKELEVSAWANPWLEEESALPLLTLRKIDSQLEWNNGPSNIEADIDVDLLMDERLYRIFGKVHSEKNSIEIEDMEFTVDNEPIALLSGTTLIAFDEESEQSYQLEPSSTFNLDIQTKKSKLLSSLASEYLPFEVDDVDFEMNLSGELGSPQGDISLSVHVPKEEGEYGLPEAEIGFAAMIKGESVTISRVALSTEGDTFEGSGEVTLPKAAFSDLLQGLEVAWQSTQYKIELPKSDLTPISRFAPQLLAPGGTIEANVSGVGPESLDGFCTIENVNTRSLFPFGALREINSQMKFENSVFELTGFEGKIGREAIVIAGKYDLENAAFDFAVDAENVALLRQSGMLVRSDLDLELVQEAGGVASISGLINLREGLFMMDTSALVGGGAGGRSVDSRPPYFSVNVPPLSDWNLNLAVKGEKFMRLQTPAATGVLSIDMELKGKLAEPWLQGSVLFDEGDLVFPFAAFEITDGSIDFPIDDPYTPTIAMKGETRRFGYDVSVEISEEAFDPQVRFTSSPPLSSEQILLMVMAGENPEGVGSYGNSKKASKIGGYLTKGLFSSGKESKGIGSRLSIDSGQNLSRQGKETMSVEFKFDERNQLVAEYDEYDAWNVGLRFKVMRQRLLDEQDEKSKSRKVEERENNPKAVDEKKEESK